MTADLKAMAKDVAQHRDEIIERMVNFSLTDTLLFRNPDAEDLIAEERQVWDPIVEWAKKNMDADFKTSESLEVPMENNASLPRLQAFRAAFLEEIWQADKWGHDAEADQRREVIRQELIDVEKFLAE